MNSPDGRRLELLAPAKDLECAITAIDSGADSLYIGGPSFGARSAAANSIEDLKQVVRHARLFRAKVYLTLNTLLFDHEIEEANRLLHQAYDAGIDAAIIQDMGLLETRLPPLPLFASTQCHNTTPDKVRFLRDCGFQRVILARELSLKEIAAIRKAVPDVELEFFLRGALCVCFSGQCYLSYAMGGRSGNRGECAQPCRKRFRLENEHGKTLVKDGHLLSLKDLDLGSRLEELIDAGIDSFKIEGRYKSADYVRNTVTHDSQLLDQIAEKKGIPRLSSGKVRHGFDPRPSATFNREFSPYLLDGKRRELTRPATPKSAGEFVGTVMESRKGFFTLNGRHDLRTGDGITWSDPTGRLVGDSVQKVLPPKIFLNKTLLPHAGAEIRRNFSVSFSKTLKQTGGQRKIRVDFTLEASPGKFLLTARDEDGFEAEAEMTVQTEAVREPERVRQRWTEQLAKLGDTVFEARSIDICPDPETSPPVKLMNKMRREVTETLCRQRENTDLRQSVLHQLSPHPYPENSLDYRGNVLNKQAEAFYRRHGVTDIQPAAESGMNMEGREVFRSRFCLLYEHSLCPKQTGRDIPPGRLFLTDENNRRLEIKIDCKRCEMFLLQKK